MAMVLPNNQNSGILISSTQPRPSLLTVNGCWFQNKSNPVVEKKRSGGIYEAGCLCEFCSTGPHAPLSVCHSPHFLGWPLKSWSDHPMIEGGLVSLLIHVQSAVYTQCAGSCGKSTLALGPDH